MKARLAALARQAYDDVTNKRNPVPPLCPYDDMYCTHDIYCRGVNGCPDGRDKQARP